MSELRALTGARGIAAWWVVLFHLRLYVPLSAGMLALLARGYLAVDFFFLLSGFVIWITWHERIAAARWQVVPEFLLKRIARVWPLHLVMLGFAVVLALLLAASGHPDAQRFPFAALPAHLLLVQDWGIADPLAWNDPAWSISAELFAYLLFPLIVMAIDWKRLGTPALLLAAVLVISLPAALMAAMGVRSLAQGITHFGLLRCSAEFSAGTLVGAMWWRWRDRAALPAVAAALVAAAGLAAWWSQILVETTSIPIAFAGLLLVLALTANHPRNPLAWRLPHYLGEISFATYLSHSLLWKAFALAVVHGALKTTWPVALVFLALVWGASDLLYRRLERPAQRRLMALGRGRRPAPARQRPAA